MLQVLGMHIASPNAGEVIQGFALAVKKGITYDVSNAVRCCCACLLRIKVVGVANVLITPPAYDPQEGLFLSSVSFCHFADALVPNCTSLRTW
jgi:hypothetical protein